MSFISAVREYLLTCPALQGMTLSVDYLSEHAGEAAVDGGSVPEILRRYTDGSAICAYSFTISARLEWMGDADCGIASREMLEEISGWFGECGTLPELGDLGQAISVEALPGGLEYDGRDSSARYQMNCRLVFYKKRS